MDSTFWKKNIIEAIEDIADEDFQRTAWFGLSDKVSSPEEVYAILLYDFIFEDFLKLKENGLTESQKEACYKLIDALDAYPSHSSSLPSPELMIDDPEWEAVRVVARRCLEELRG
ncbi:MAG TPA: hypothetical protein PKD28_02145 [Candidatus Saccharibacteria bacterium]|nr:hypothetical protein [Candidatus Saccharibacteria bacterium]